MEKLAQDLKKGFRNIFESIKGHKSSTATKDGEGEEARSESAEKVSVQERAVKVAKGATRPTPPQGPPPQTA